MELSNIKVKSITAGLPFGLGGVELEINQVEEHAAWSLYVELATRSASQPFDAQSGGLREVLNSLYEIFGLTRSILREAGPSVAHGGESFGPLAIEVLNVGLRPFITKWHSRLKEYEQTKATSISAAEHERRWEYYHEMVQELAELKVQMDIYVALLAQIAGVEE